MTSKVTVNITFISPVHNHLGGKHNCLHAKSRYKKRKSTLLIVLNRKKALSGGRWTTFFPFPSSYVASFPSSDRKWTDLIRQKWTSKCLLPHLHVFYKYKFKKTGRSPHSNHMKDLQINHRYEIKSKTKKFETISCMGKKVMAHLI